MKLGLNLDYFFKEKREMSLQEIVRYAECCKEKGFESLDYITDFKRDDWDEHAKKCRELMDVNNITVHQSHAPFNRYRKYDKDEVYREYLTRAVDIAAILGAEYLVIHADEYRPSKGEKYEFEKVRDFMYDYFAPFVDRANEKGVGVAFENLFEDCDIKGQRSRYASTAEEVIALIECFSGANVSCCWDFGHAQVTYGKRAFDYFKQVFPYITCTHVHDNFFGMDLHLLPLQGEVDWTSHIQYMKEQHYKGNFSLEFSHGQVPDEILPEFLRFARKSAEYVLSL